MKNKKPPARIKRSEAFLGIHFDFHAGMDCMAVGKTLTRTMLRKMLEQVKPDYVQCDCKGHPGIASYPTTVGNPVPGFVRDPLKLWREVTAECGVSLYVHYSGVVDQAAVAQHPEWAARQPNGDIWPGVTSVFGPYVDELMIPMFKELVDRYDIDGAWVDGECWGVEMDYSHHARKAWKKATGLDNMPVERGDKHFERFRNFQREGFRKYLAHYIDAMHAYAPGFEIASNWAYTAHMPEPVAVDMDFISGDITPQSALTEALMDARVLAQQGKPWDLMAWSFNSKWGEQGATTKPAVQLQQEAGVVMAAGGGFQAYFKQKRDASLYPWTMEVMAEVGVFCRQRQPYCQHTESIPQVGLILSRHAYYKHIDKLMRPWGRVYQSFRGILCNLLDSQNVVDVVMDHNLEADINRYPLLVLPEWKNIGAALKKRLVSYVEAGGNLLLIGVNPTRLFRKELNVALEGKPAEQARYVEVDGHMGGAFTVMQKVVPQSGTTVTDWLYEGNEAVGERMPAAVETKRGNGTIAAIPMNMGERYLSGRTSVARDFLHKQVYRLMPQPVVEVTGSHLIAVSLMRKRIEDSHTANPQGANKGFPPAPGPGNRELFIHLNNLGGGRAGACYTFDEIPPVGPLEVNTHLLEPPAAVFLQPEGRALEWTFDKGTVTVHVSQVDIHEIIEIRF